MIIEEHAQNPERVQIKPNTLSRAQRRLIITCILVIGDTLALGAAFLAAYYIRFELMPYLSIYSIRQYTILTVGIVLPLLWFFFAINQLYNTHTLFGGLEEYSRIFNSISSGLLLFIVYGFLTREETIFSRGWLILSWFFAVIFAIGFRFSFRRVIYALRRKGYLLSPTLIIGANNEGIALARQLQQWSTSGLYLTGFIDTKLPMNHLVLNGYSVVGNLDDLERLIGSDKIEEVVVAPTAISREQLLEIYQIVGPLPDVSLRLSSGLFEIISSSLQVKEIASVPLVVVNKTRVTGLEATLKFLTDYILSIILLLIIWPFLLFIAIAIKFDSPGPIIYRRRVMGVHGQEFDAFKFRTMDSESESILAMHPELRQILQQEHKLKEDPRITRFGKFLRKFSLDELPQIFNVLLGQMSLVGPRMISPPEMDKYGKWGLNLLIVKPGITGLWQISGRSDLSYEERVELDMRYIRNWSIWLDLYLILATIPAVIRKKGAY